MTTTKKTAPKKTAAPKAPKVKPARNEKPTGLSRARAMARKRGYHIRTDRGNPGTYKLSTDATLAVGGVNTLIDYMKQDETPEPAMIEEGVVA